MNCLRCGSSCLTTMVGDLSPHCGHLACDACLQAWIADQTSWHVPASHLRCFQEGCTCLLPAALTQNLVADATRPIEAPLDFSSQLKIETLRRKNLPGELLVWTSCSSTRPLCAVCQTEDVVLVANVGCRHAACQDCWEKRF